MIDLCGKYSIKAYRIPGYTGVWVDDRKIAAIGIKVKKWITQHGLSLNVNPNLQYFQNIIPCGIKEKAVGSLHKWLPDVRMEDISSELLTSFENVFEVDFSLSRQAVLNDQNDS